MGRTKYIMRFLLVLAFVAVTKGVAAGGCQNVHGGVVPCNVGGVALAVAPPAPAAPEEGGVEVEKREAGPEPTADAGPDADPWYYYSGYVPYSYGYAAPYTYGAYYHAPLTYLLGGCRNYLGSLVPCAGK